MIQETTTYVCRVCKSTHIVKNGTNRYGNAQYHCKNCGAYRVLKPTQAYSETEQQLVLRACLERCSLRGIARIFAMTRQTIVRWFRAYTQKLPDVKETLLPATPIDVLELDEIWSFVQQKEQTRWVWTAMCRRTRQIVAFVIGDRSKATCLRLWQSIPHEYKHCHIFSDFWPAYQYVFPPETHHCVGKETGETAHIERWNNTLRQRIGRSVRQTLSFSQSDEYHHLITLAFIVQYNLGLSLTT
jgi:IS1 family transposase/transposase-like protein